MRAREPLNIVPSVSEADRGRKTFGEIANDLMKSKSSEWHNAVHRAQWKQTLETYARPLWNMPVDEIDTRDVLAVLTPLWPRIPETAARLRGRIEAVLNAAKAHGLRSGENPAAWRGHLANLLPKRSKVAPVRHHSAMAYDAIPAFLARLRESNTKSSSATEFLIVSSLDLNPRLQTGRGFSRFLFID
jgi:integrase